MTFTTWPHTAPYRPCRARIPAKNCSSVTAWSRPSTAHRYQLRYNPATFPGRS
ncbi:hypothetical protein [Amycolatopsis sp. NBC_01480]|uniref:hypothetical protein n=1 Tax=Amycolatopsis sp. NBC_01480 TaxID=2903562 RepID=UPI002E280F82|nr:hypothetical protein [Amycolatopsis sp. NBC_01480]